MSAGRGSPALVVAPMVNQSDAPFRSLCFRYGATCCYTEMLYGERIVKEEGYLSAYWPECDEVLGGGEVVVQVCGNDAETLAEAVKRIACRGRDGGQGCAAVDLNLGCPQERAKTGMYGSFLLDKPHWPLVYDCVSSMVSALEPYDTPLFCKIRLIDDSAGVFPTTTLFCRGLCERGVKLICIHGRTRGSVKRRRCGPADLDMICRIAECIRESFPDVHIIANGNIHDVQDARDNLNSTSHVCCGVMSAEGVLRNPALFSQLTSKTTFDNKHTIEVDRTMQIPDLFTLFAEYCKLSEQYRVAGGWEGFDNFESERLGESKQLCLARQHLSWMLGKTGHGRLVRYKYGISGGNVARTRCDNTCDGFHYKKHVHILNDLNVAKTIDDLLLIAKRCLLNEFAEVREADHPTEQKL